MNDSHLSKNRKHLNKRQRARRARLQRIDYMPNQNAAEIINAKRDPNYPLNTNSGVIDAILIEWANLTGIKYGKVEKSMTSGSPPELCEAYARACDFGLSQSTPRKIQSDYCGANTKSGNPCRGKKLPNKNRCKWHGGCSTGPKTSEGKAKAIANLKQYKEGKAIY